MSAELKRLRQEVRRLREDVELIKDSLGLSKRRPEPLDEKLSKQQEQKIEKLLGGMDRIGGLTYNGEFTKAEDFLPVAYLAERLGAHEDTIRSHLRRLDIAPDKFQRVHLRRLAASLVLAKERRAANVRPYQTLDGVTRKRRKKLA